MPPLGFADAPPSYCAGTSQRRTVRATSVQHKKTAPCWTCWTLSKEIWFPPKRPDLPTVNRCGTTWRWAGKPQRSTRMANPRQLRPLVPASDVSRFGRLVLPPKLCTSKFCWSRFNFWRLDSKSTETWSSQEAPYTADKNLCIANCHTGATKRISQEHQWRTW